MGGYDWNGNGGRDAFDSFMDMEVMSDSDSSSWSSDFDSDDVETEDFKYTPIGSGLSSARPQRTTKAAARSFQEQLLDNLRSLETVKREEEKRVREAAQAEADRAMQAIKKTLVAKARSAEYAAQNGEITVSCFTWITSRYMRFSGADNMKQWTSYEIDPKNKQEYYFFLEALRKLAAKDGIQVEPVVYNRRTQAFSHFPATVQDVGMHGWELCIHAVSVIPPESKQPPKPKPKRKRRKTNVAYVKPEPVVEEKESIWSKIGTVLIGIAIFVAILVVLAAIGLGPGAATAVIFGIVWVLYRMLS